MHNNYKSDFEYYENSGNLPKEENRGSYQYVFLEDIVNNFMLMYQGDHELINNINRFKVLFFAKRGVQELNYDAVREVKVLQLKVSDKLQYILPPDYVNFVKISLFKDGLLYPLTENIQTNFSTEFVQDQDYIVVFDEDGVSVKAETSHLDYARLYNTAKSIYLNPQSPYNNSEGWNIDGSWYFDHNPSGRTGLNTETANRNPTFSIDRAGGVINFGSEMSDESCVLEYVSDGMEYTSELIGGEIVPRRVDGKVKVNKMFEEYIYAYIKYSILKNKLGTQEYIVNRSKREMIALLRNARIRISNIHPSRLLMSLRGQDKMIK